MRDFDFDRYQEYQERLRRPRTARWWYLAVAVMVAGSLFAIGRDLVLHSQPESRMPSGAPGTSSPTAGLSAAPPDWRKNVEVRDIPGGREVTIPGHGTFRVYGTPDSPRVRDEQDRPVPVPKELMPRIQEFMGR